MTVTIESLASDTNDVARVAPLLELLQELPPENQPIFRRLWVLLGQVAANEPKTKMSSKNLR